MPQGSTSLHEPFENLSQETLDLHRALVSVQEELEAIDWYQQRAEGAGDPELAAVLRHNMHEEIEHALMGLEWIRRHLPGFDDLARKILFREGSAAAEPDEDAGTEEGAPTPPAPTLGIGGLKGRS